ncbi:MAG: thiolase family protein [Halioglobus sp.]
MIPIYIAGVSMTRFGPRLQDSVKTLTRESVSECLHDATAAADDVEAAFFSNTGQAVIEGQVSIPGQIALRAAGISGIPVTNVENACASGSTAIWLARNHLLSGQADIVLAVGTEKMAYEDKTMSARVFQAFEGGSDIENTAAVLAELKSLSSGHEFEEATGHRTMFMDIYVQLCRAHMVRFGTTQQQLAVIASKNHDHASLNSKCHYNKRMSIEEILAARSIGYPLTVPMCSPLSDGSAAAILCTEAGLKKLGAESRAVQLLSSVMTSATERSWDDFDNHLVRRAALQAYEEAGLGPRDVDVVEVHDAAAFGELFMSELLGFCESGAGGELAESGATRIGGRIPINPSGGLESKGHPIGATGLGQAYELVTQLRGEAGQRQVDDAKVAVQENGGGLLGVEEGAAVVNIYSR